MVSTDNSLRRSLAIGERFNPYRLFDGVFIPEALCRYRSISPGAKLAYGRFCRYAGNRGEVYPSIASLGREIGCSATQARAYVQELKNDRFIEVEETPGRPNTYHFLWHPAFEGDEGRIRFAPTPLQDAGGVAEETEPLQDAGGVPLQDAGAPPLQDAGGERESIEESQKKREIPPTPSFEENTHELPQSADEIITNLSSLRRRTKAGRIKGKELALLNERVPVLLGEFTGEQIEQAFAAFVADEYWGERKLPVSGFLSQIHRFVQDSPRQYGRDFPGFAAAPSAATHQPPSTPEPATRLQTRFAQRWNELVPARPIDVALCTETFPAFADPAFTENFDRVCEKAAALIDGGATITYFDLFRQDRDSRLPWWKRLLAGALDWMAAPRAKTRGERGGDAIEQALARVES